MSAFEEHGKLPDNLEGGGHHMPSTECGAAPPSARWPRSRARGRTLVDRRDALRRLAAAGVGTALAPPWVERLVALAHARTAGPQHLGSIEQAAAPWTPTVLTAHQNATVALISELIIPATDTAGAAAAKVNEFIDAILEDAHEAERREFLGGLDWIDVRCRELFGDAFVACAAAQQAALLTIISSDRNTALEDRAGVAFFRAVKALTITGYYNSEVGMREELADDGVVFFPDDPGCTHPPHKDSEAL